MKNRGFLEFECDHFENTQQPNWNGVGTELALIKFND